MEMIVRKNKYWSDKAPLVSVVTSVYNRRDVLLRAMQSVNAQTFRDFEYIVVDNGSTIDIDDIVITFMDSVNFPVLYVKKGYGGPHEGRNCGTRLSRGEYRIGLDSDDEFTPETLRVFVDAWNSIPEAERKQYREVVALCKDQNGNIVGSKFPDNINDVQDISSAYTLCKNTGGEHISMDRNAIIKENLFPEPVGVSYIPEDIMWKKLEVYKGLFINKALRVYHTESDDSITNRGKRTYHAQIFINKVWYYQYLIENSTLYINSKHELLKNMFKLQFFSKVLKLKKDYPEYTWLTNRNNCSVLTRAICSIPAELCAVGYVLFGGR